MAAQLHIIEPSKIDFTEAFSVLDSGERQRAESFVFEEDRVRWTCVRAQMKWLLAERLGVAVGALRWSFNDHGKPALENHTLAFNLSHSSELSVLFIGGDAPLGIDLEPLARGDELVGDETAFCHPAELAELPQQNRDRALIELWTAKEAFLKAIGTGLSLPPQEVHVDGNRAKGPHPELAQLQLLRPSHPSLTDFALAVAGPEDLRDIDFREHRQLA